MFWKTCLKWLAVLACCFLPYSLQAEETQVMDGVDDGTVHIQLGHAFPYYGGVFTDAWMSSNGFILLYDPVNSFGNSRTWNDGCCQGFFPGGMDSPFSYMIAPFWTDLRHITSIPDSGYFYETGEGGTWFEWRNVIEYGNPDNLNTFGLQLWPDGSFDFQYAELNIQYHNVWIGFTGDATSQQGGVYNEINELFYGEYAFNGAENGMTTSDVTAFTVAQTNYGYAWWGEDGGYSGGPDCSNPLNDPSCEGYDDAYYSQQCDVDPLYDTGCPGYEQAYYDQQCSIDSLYDPGCPGYEQAYYNQQCQNSPLYDSGCPGYEEAYYAQQCTEDPLYDSGCPGYEEAFYNYSCGLDPLYDSGCPGYEQAYFNQQCDLNPLYDQACPGYQVAYDALLFAEACAADPLYDTGCDGYEEALAIQMANEQTETIIEESITEEEDFGYEEETFTEDFTGQEEFVDDGIPDFAEPEVFEVVEETFVDPVVEVAATEEEIFIEEMVLQEESPTDVFEEIFEEPVVDDVYFEEEITQVEEEVSIIEEELPISEEIELVEETAVSNEDEKRTIRTEKQTRLLAIVTEVIAETVQQAQGNTNSAQETEDFGEETTETNFEIVDFSVENEQIENESTSTLVAAEDTSSFSSLSTDLQGESGETVEETVESLTFNEQTVQFENDLTESLATGQSLGQFLSGVQPDFGKFDVAPPAPQEQKQMARAEQALSSMSQEEIEETLKENVESNQDDGGFDTDQRLTLVIMGYNPNFGQYNTVLTDNQAWYVDRGIYRGKAVHDNMRRNINLLLGSDAKHKALVDLQYD